MKKINWFKLIQTAILLVLAAFCISWVLANTTVRQNILTNPDFRPLGILLWALLIFCFVCLFLDFFLMVKLKKENFRLKHLAYLDSLTGMPNRLSVDERLDLYTDAELPEEIGCVMIRLDSLSTINCAQGRPAGNQQLMAFSRLLQEVGKPYGFVGRNTGNTFLALIEHGSQEAAEQFQSDLKQAVQTYNLEHQDATMAITVGVALHKEEDTQDLVQLVRLASQRLH